MRLEGAFACDHKVLGDHRGHGGPHLSSFVTHSVNTFLVWSRRFRKSRYEGGPPFASITWSRFNGSGRAPARHSQPSSRNRSGTGWLPCDKFKTRPHPPAGQAFWGPYFIFKSSADLPSLSRERVEKNWVVTGMALSLALGAADRARKGN